jgi:hypothetical protein
MHIKKAAFSRVIPNGGQLIGEVKVWPVKEEAPMLAWFVREADGCLSMQKLIRKQEELDLDWYDNDLRQAFQDVTSEWFTEPQSADACNRTEFEREVLDYQDVAAELEEHLWATEQELSKGAVFGAFARPDPSGAHSDAHGTQLH